MLFRAGFYGLIVGMMILAGSGLGLLNPSSWPTGTQAVVSAQGDNGDDNAADDNAADDNAADDNAADDNAADNGGDNAPVVVTTEPTPTPVPAPAPPPPPAPAPPPPPPPAVAEPCFFTQGFAFLRGVIIQTEGSDPIGPCLENEHGNVDPVTGQLVNRDTLQQAANGLYVWQEFTNTMRTTNGFMTWTYSKCGLQKRVNTQTFVWEQNPSLMAGPSPTPPPGACDLA